MNKRILIIAALALTPVLSFANGNVLNVEDKQVVVPFGRGLARALEVTFESCKGDLFQVDAGVDKGKTENSATFTVRVFNTCAVPNRVTKYVIDIEQRLLDLRLDPETVSLTWFRPIPCPDNDPFCTF